MKVTRLERLENKELTLREKAEELLTLVCELKTDRDCEHNCGHCTEEIEDYLLQEV